MNDDIVDRLKQHGKLFAEAVAEIERLRAELERFRIADQQRRAGMKRSFYDDNGWFPS